MLSIPDMHDIEGFRTEFLDLFIIATILIQLGMRKYPPEEIFQHKLPQFLSRTLHGVIK